MTWKKLGLVIVMAGGLAACGVSREIAETAGGVSGCTSCHGDANRSGSELRKAAPADAAHVAHVETWGADCSTCHVVPSSPAHMNGVVDVVFAGAAMAGGAQPTFAGGTCSGVYCHGGTLSGGKATSLPWSRSGPLACDACHGAPPPTHAASSTSCSGCHPGTVKPDGTIARTNGLHANGTVEAGVAHGQGWANPAQHGPAAKADLAGCQGCHGVAFDGGTTGVSCNACHGGTAWMTNCTFCHGTKLATYTAGDLGQAAPPRGTAGETATTTRAVGAHQRHLSGGNIGPAVACAECHDVPTDLSHLDASAAVAFGPAASRGGATPVWNGATCASTYCHGATVAGGTKKTPSWTGGSAEAACGTCHGAPPPAPHTTSTACGSCHTGYGTTTVNATLHMNGAVDAPAAGAHAAGWGNRDQHGYEVNRTGLASCKSCHGATLTGGAGPSCATCHTGGAAWATSCTFCHGTGTNPAPPVDTQGRTATTNVSVGVHAAHLATTLMPAPACTVCHPNRAASNVVTDAAHVDGNAIAEVTFGGLAVSGGSAATYTRLSPTSATCASTYCHGATVTGGTDKTPNWTSTAQATCGSCHGAPPPAPHTTSTACGSCHTGYGTTTVNATLHMNGTVDAPAGGGHPAGWGNRDQHGYEVNRTGLASCKTCHGATLTGGAGPSCATCHTGGAAWATSCTFCHGSGTNPAPPVDTQGRSVTTNVSVGAHASHLGTTIMRTPACTECHPNRAGSDVVTDAAHIDGNAVAEVAFGTLARTGGAAATYTRTSATAASCASTYCHGRFTGGASSGAGATMSWTATTQAACTSCHGAPPSTGRHSKHVSGESIACGTCHPGYTSSSVSAITHVDGLKQVGGTSGWNATNRSCSNSCHGSKSW